MPRPRSHAKEDLIAAAMRQFLAAWLWGDVYGGSGQGDGGQSAWDLF